MFAVALTVAGPAMAQSMNAEVYNQRIQALMKKGAMALFSMGEINKLTAEAKAAGIKSNNLRLAAVRSGGKPRFCPPAGQNLALGQKEFLSRFGQIPPGERAHIDMTEAMTRVFAGKYPCS
ncbi:hypothetical protein HMF7854_04055 [Sphingomonas ginkgonis]|uniref:Rap1a immunity protein domain-containing protein n=1 Tax=Sphingomonas ginkgonis TaxID=2315330 RepID=A0A429V825_9SPHN|nr:hypothetical protein [Sphingomonas ginkgonis]RST30089.1 hypothetical protein HMF7854_04055 [Sphingomonas ginkgonis]